MVGKIRSAWRRYISGFVAIALMLGLVAVVLPGQAHAGQVQNRSITLSSINPGATASHTFRFTYVTTDTPVGSIVFQYCTSPLEQVTCDAPNGLDASHATFSGQSGEVGYQLLTAQTNKLILTRPAMVPSGQDSHYSFDNIINPTDEGTFYVRISTYQSTDGSLPELDFGGVAASISSGQVINAEVPPYLKFCVGLTIADDCSTADGNLIDLGDLTNAHVSYGSSQMMGATNAESGLMVVVYGTTMTSGNNAITALANPTPSAPGNAQFGLNLRANSNPNIGQEPTGGGISTVAANYNIPNRYLFNNGDTVVTSPGATDTRKFTSSYIVNVPPSQAPGVYTATLTYICTASF